MLKFDVTKNNFSPRYIFADDKSSYSGYDLYFWHFNCLIELIIQANNKKDITTITSQDTPEIFLKILQEMKLIKYKIEKIRPKFDKNTTIEKLHLFNIETYEIKMILSIFSSENFIEEPYGKEKQIRIIKDFIKNKYNKFENDELIIRQCEINETDSSHIEFLGVIFYLEEESYIDIIKKDNTGENGEINLHSLVKENNFTIKIKEKFKKEIEKERLLLEKALGFLVKNSHQDKTNKNNKKITIFIDRINGIYKNEKTKNPCYPIKSKIKRFKALEYLNKYNNLSPTALSKKLGQSYPNLNKAIKEINENFKFNLNLKKDLIIQSSTSLYLLNKDDYNIIFK